MVEQYCKYIMKYVLCIRACLNTLLYHSYMRYHWPTNQQCVITFTFHDLPLKTAVSKCLRIFDRNYKVFKKSKRWHDHQFFRSTQSKMEITFTSSIWTGFIQKLCSVTSKWLWKYELWTSTIQKLKSLMGCMSDVVNEHLVDLNSSHIFSRWWSLWFVRYSDLELQRCVLEQLRVDISQPDNKYWSRFIICDKKSEQSHLWTALSSNSISGNDAELWSVF